MIQRIPTTEYKVQAIEPPAGGFYLWLHCPQGGVDDTASRQACFLLVALCFGHDQVANSSHEKNASKDREHPTERISYKPFEYHVIVSFSRVQDRSPQVIGCK